MTRFLLLPALVLACNADPYDAGNAANAEAKPAGAHAEATKTATPTKSDAKDADEEGCIYAEGHKDKSGKACGHDGEPAAAKTGQGHFGAAFTLADAKPLEQAVATKPEGPVLVKGEVEAVCQKKGCWLVIKDGAQSARVKMKDYGFTVPMDSRGKQATVEGTLSVKTWNEAQVKHLEKDGGGDPSKVSGTKTENLLLATGIEITS